MEQRHVLVLGAPRSGTTLLASMIARHRDVSMLDEYRGDPGLIE
ncbi:MAG: sulfotransferase, partial [Candidatus Binatia bacterium]